VQAGDKIREWLAQAVGGDAVAMERLLLHHYNQVAGHIARNLNGPLKSACSTEDVLQETFVHAVRDIRRCSCESDMSFGHWLIAIADHRLHEMRRAIECKKRGGGRPPLSARASVAESSLIDVVELLAADGATPSGIASSREAVTAVQVGIAALPEDQREAVRRHFIQQRTVDETAAGMGRSPDAVRGLLHRAKQALRKTLVRSSLWLTKK
jgi:RNA polymerase sigma factor (sigma-70 family)